MTESLGSTDNRNISLAAKQRVLAEELERLRVIAPEAAELPLAIQEILRFIHAHLFEPSLRVKTVRLSCRMRNHNISTQFRLVMGIGIREYIEALRLEMAKKLLLKADIEIYIVAATVGYDSQETFCRAFQRYFGCTATEHRFRTVSDCIGQPEEKTSSTLVKIQGQTKAWGLDLTSQSG
jgi:AraC-like DNA-binding protein